MLIEIRSEDGERLACAGDLSGAINQIVELCGRYRVIVESYHRMLEKALVIQPDTSAIAPEYTTVYSAGWNAALREVAAISMRE